MIITSYTVGPLAENCLLVVDPATQDAVLVDPGYEADRLAAAVDKSGARLTAIWLTHGHIDHVGAVAPLVRKYGVPVALHPNDEPLYARSAEIGGMYGMVVEPPPAAEVALAEGQTVTVGSLEFVVWHLPGHSPGQVAFVGHGVALSGDCLFAGSIGRTDLPLSSPQDMQRSLVRMATWAPETTVYPGHGPNTTIERELAANPFLRGVARPISR